MEVRVEQEVVDMDGDRLPTICDAFPIKCEESLTETVLDVDKALLERARAVTSQSVVAGQVMSRYLTSCYDRSC